MWQQNMPYCCRSISGGVGREDGLVVLVDLVQLSQPLPTPAPARTRQRTDGDILAVVGDQREVGNLLFTEPVDAFKFGAPGRSMASSFSSPLVPKIAHWLLVS